jgi:hypothetical protein
MVVRDSRGPERLVGKRLVGRRLAGRPARRAARVIVALATCVGLTFSNVSVSPAQDAQSAGADLAHSADFRVRVSAAVFLGKTHPDGARVMLEHALDDAHPAVRTAAAAALASLGDPAAVAALERHARGESSGAARAQMQTSIATLSRAESNDAPAPSVNAHPRYAVAIGQMRNKTGIRGDDLSAVLREAARTHAHELAGALVVDADDPAASRAQGKMPVLLLEGQITRLAQAQTNGAMRIEARVEFSVRRVPQQILKGTLSGGATAVESMRTLNQQRVVELENQTIGSAAESALQGADTGLALAAK